MVRVAAWPGTILQHRGPSTSSSSTRRSGRNRANWLIASSVAISLLVAGQVATAWVSAEPPRLHQPAAGGPKSSASRGSNCEGVDDPSDARPANRRALFQAGAAAAASSAVAPLPAFAKEPKITDRVEFDIQLERGNRAKNRVVVIGVFGEDAPALSTNFLMAVDGSYKGETGRQARYLRSDVKHIYQDKAIEWANFQGGNVFYKIQQVENGPRWVSVDTSKIPLAGPDTYTDETNELRHNMKGRVSMKRGGGSFDFTVAPVDNANWLDEDHVVIGQVIEGMDVIDDINRIGSLSREEGKPKSKIRTVAVKRLPA